jgi:hypothetical protein
MQMNLLAPQIHLHRHVFKEKELLAVINRAQPAIYLIATDLQSTTAARLQKPID